MKKSTTVLVFSLFKVAVTIALIVLICLKIDFSALINRLNGGGTIYLFLGTSLLAINVLIVAMRWWLLLCRLGVVTMSLGTAMTSTYVSVFVGQVMPGSIGADAVRGWLCYRHSVKLRAIVMSLVTDRLLALVGLITVAGVVWFWQFGASGSSVGRQAAILGALVAGASAVVLWLIPALTGRLTKRWARLQAVHELVQIFRHTALSLAGLLGWALSCIVAALTVNAAILFGRGFGVSLDPAVAYLIIPIAIIFSSLPISIGGWGVREASLTYGLHLFGVPSGDAALIGLALGVGLVLASLPGGLVMLTPAGQLRPPPRRAGGLVE